MCSVSVEPNSVSDLVGNRNEDLASLAVQYRPPSASLDALATTGNVLFGSLLAGCLGATYAAAALQPYAPAVVGCGALSLVGFMQAVFLTGQLSPAWLPEGYRQVAAKFGWSVGQIRWVPGSAYLLV